MNIFLKRHLRPKEGDSYLYEKLLREKVIDFSEMEKIRRVRWLIFETFSELAQKTRRLKSEADLKIGLKITILLWFAFEFVILAVFADNSFSPSEQIWIAALGTLGLTGLLGFFGCWDLYIRAFFRRLRKKSWHREPIFTEDVTDYIDEHLSDKLSKIVERDSQKWIKDNRGFGAIADLSPTWEKIGELSREVENIDKENKPLRAVSYKLDDLKSSKDHSQAVRELLTPDIEKIKEKYFSKFSHNLKKRRAANHHQERLYIAIAEAKVIADKLSAVDGYLKKYEEQAQLFRKARNTVTEFFPDADLNIPESMKKDAREIKSSLQNLRKKVDEVNKLAQKPADEVYQEWEQKKEQQSKEKQMEEETKTTE